MLDGISLRHVNVQRKWKKKKFKIQNKEGY